MTKVSVIEAKAHFSELLAKAEAGHEVTITRRGTPVARLIPLDRPKRPLRLEAIDAFRAKLKPSAEPSVDLIRRMRDESY